MPTKPAHDFSGLFFIVWKKNLRGNKNTCPNGLGLSRVKHTWNTCALVSLGVIYQAQIKIAKARTTEEKQRYSNGNGQASFVINAQNLLSASIPPIG
jgi:hypothetical protein